MNVPWQSKEMSLSELSTSSSRIKSTHIPKSFLSKLTSPSQLLQDQGILLMWSDLGRERNINQLEQHIFNGLYQTSEALACLSSLPEHCLKTLARSLSILLENIWYLNHTKEAICKFHVNESTTAAEQGIVLAISFLPTNAKISRISAKKAQNL